MESPFSLYKDEADERNGLEFFSGKGQSVKRKALYKIYMYYDQKKFIYTVLITISYYSPKGPGCRLPHATLRPFVSTG